MAKQSVLDVPKRYLCACRFCWGTVLSDKPVKTCTRTLGVGTPCQGTMLVADNPEWVKRERRRKAPAVPVVEQKPEVSGRAGSHLSLGSKVSVWARGKDPTKKEVHGTLDMAKRIYQTGGEAGNFILRSKGLITMALDAWRRAEDGSDTMEFIDHTRNVCYRVRTYVLRRNRGTQYDAGIGERIGWPIDWFDIVDAQERVLTPGNPPKEVQG